MLNLIEEVVTARALARTALDDLVCIVHHDGILGVGVREHPALVNQVIAAFGAPPLHPVTPPRVVLGELHQAEVGKVVGVHIHQSDLQTDTSSMRPEQDLALYPDKVLRDRYIGNSKHLLLQNIYALYFEYLFPKCYNIIKLKWEGYYGTL